MDVRSNRETRVSQPLEEPQVSELYRDLRPLLFSIAYRMVSSVGEAEDIVQESFLRYHRVLADGQVVDSPKAFLCSIATRLAIDHLRSARVRRETYVGTWLPEPLLTEAEPDAAHHAETADSLSMAFLVLLENLTPVERAVFLLREVFEYGYDEIASMIGKSEDNCRQIAVRARRRIEDGRPRFEASRRRREELARRFFAAAEEGDSEALIRMLAADVVAYGDGGGKAPAFPRPVHGRENVGRLLAALSDRRGRLPFVRWRHAEINGQPGAVFTDEQDAPVLIVTLDIADDQIQTIRAVANPDKLRHLAGS
jgi:RNA polymerase sigma-70 factor (ECF subfamily)